MSEELRGNAFSIRTSRPRTRVSWLVTGVRHAAWAERNRIPVELDKGHDRAAIAKVHARVANLRRQQRTCSRPR